MKQLVVFFLCFLYVRGQLRPQNTVSIVGSTVRLECSLGGESNEWLFSRSGSRYVRVNATGRYSIDNSIGYNLIIRNVKLTDAGVYECKSQTKDAIVKACASLMVLGGLECTTNASASGPMENDKILFTCKAKNVTQEITMNWGKKTQEIIANDGEHIKQTVIPAVVPEIPPLVCTVSPVNQTIDNMATNTPTLTCQTPVVRVQHSVKTVNLSPAGPIFLPGDTINCTADGEPPPVLKWQSLENGTWVDIMDGGQITITTWDLALKFLQKLMTIMESNSGSIINDATSNAYRCFAMNQVRGVGYNATSAQFTVTSPNFHIALIVAGVGISSILIILAVCIKHHTGFQCCPTLDSKKKLVTVQDDIEAAASIEMGKLLGPQDKV